MDGVLTSRDARGGATVTLNRPERRSDDAPIGEVDCTFAKRTRASAEGREGLAAFLETRQPAFRS